MPSQRPECQYRLVDKCMRQRRLMKLDIINEGENNLLSGVVSISLVSVLNPPHPSLKYAIQFSLIDIPQNLLRELEKTGPRQLPTSVRIFLSLSEIS
jgi:hypothetical protein